MKKSLSNTLTRWHKIAERIQKAAQEIRAKNVSVLNSTQSIDVGAFDVRQESLKASTEKVLGEQTALYLALQGALFQIRKELAKANVKLEACVSDLLADMEFAKQTEAYYAALLETADNALSVAEFAALAKKRAGTNNGMYDVSVTFISAEKQAYLAEQRDNARREKDSLANRLSDANASKLALELDEQVVAFMGL
jgi:hypothetical protein